MPTKSLGTLTADLILKTGGFVQGMTAAERQSAKTAAQIRKQHKQLAADLDKIFRGIATGAAAAFAALGVSVKTSIDDMWNLATVAKQIAMPVDQFSALAAVAKDAEISTDSLSTGLRTMAKNLALAQQGSAQAVAAFKSIGLDPTKLKDSKAAFLAISDALSKYRDDVNKTAIEQQIFGRSGAELNALLDQGSGAISKLMDEQREMGNTVTPAAAKALGEYDDTMDRLTDQVTGLRNKLAIALLPAIVSVNKSLSDFAGSQGASDFASGLSTVLITLGRAAMVVVAAFDEVGKAIGGAMAIAQQATQGLTLTESLSPFSMATRFAKNAAAVKATARQVTADIGADVTMWMGKIATFGDDATQQAKKAIAAKGSGSVLPSIHLQSIGADKDVPDVGIAIAKMQAGFSKLLNQDIAAQLQKQVTAEHDAVEAVAQYGTASEKAAAQQTLLNEQVRLMTRDMLPQLTTMGLSTADAMKVINARAADLVKTSNKQFAELTEYAKEAARNIQDAFAQFLFDPMDGGFKGLLKNFGDMLRKMAAQLAASKLLQALGTWLGGSSTGWVSAIGQAFSSYGGGKATGGPVHAGTTYLVGEKGPELFTPSSGGTITTNSQMRNMGGGNIVVNSSVSVNNGDDANNVSAARQLGKMIEVQTKAVIVRQMKPGGILWKQRNGVAA